MSSPSVSLLPAAASEVDEAKQVAADEVVSKSMLLHMRIEFGSWWGNKSKLVKRGTTAYRFKKRFQYFLAKRGMVFPDRPNNVAHVALTTDSQKRLPAAADAVEGHEIYLTENSFLIEKDNIQIPFSVKSPVIGPTHMTLFFTKLHNFLQEPEAHKTLVETFRETLQSFIDHPVSVDGDELFAVDTVLNSDETDADVKNAKAEEKSAKAAAGAGNGNGGGKRERKRNRHQEQDGSASAAAASSSSSSGSGRGVEKRQCLVEVADTMNQTMIEIRDALRELVRVTSVRNPGPSSVENHAASSATPAVARTVADKWEALRVANGSCPAPATSAIESVAPAAATPVAAVGMVE